VGVHEGQRSTDARQFAGVNLTALQLVVVGVQQFGDASLGFKAA